jgi:D-amino-acid oxidase
MKLSGPYLIGSTPDNKINEWSKSAHDFFHELWVEGKAEEAGISMIPAYRLTSDPKGQPDPSWKDVVFGFSNLTQPEIKKLSDEHLRNYTAGNHFITFCCEPKKFLPYLERRFLASGGKLEKRKVSNLDEFNNVDLIVNCTGFGSKEILKDSKLQAIRGQVARVRAPFLYEVMMQEDDDGNYVIPNTNEVILGGTHQVDDFNLNVSATDSEFIFNGCRKVFPGLSSVEVISEQVGLRPGRTEVRLEIERRSQKPTVVHCYGHGGCGVTLCWGCADEVLSKTIEALKFSEIVSKL